MNDSEDSEDQGSAASDDYNISNHSSSSEDSKLQRKTYRSRQAVPLLRGQPFLSSWKVTRRCRLRTLREITIKKIRFAINTNSFLLRLVC